MVAPSNTIQDVKDGERWERWFKCNFIPSHRNEFRPNNASCRYPFPSTPLHYCKANLIVSRKTKAVKRKAKIKSPFLFEDRLFGCPNILMENMNLSHTLHYFNLMGRFLYLADVSSTLITTPSSNSLSYRVRYLFLMPPDFLLSD